MNTNFDLINLCSSDDRDSTAAENQTTFILTNIVLQAPPTTGKAGVYWENMFVAPVDQGNER